jgi:hypothetical protein
MQEQFYILTIFFFITIAAGATFITIRLFNKRRYRKNREKDYPEDSLKPVIKDIILSNLHSYISSASSGSENNFPSLEREKVVDESRTGQKPVVTDTVQSSQEVSFPTPTVVQLEDEKEETKSTNLNTEKESESNSTARSINNANDNTPSIHVPTGNVPFVKEEIIDDKPAPAGFKEDEVQNQLKNIEPTIKGAYPKVQEKLPPEKRGGARRGQREIDTRVKEASSVKSTRSRKPEVVCWQQSRKWFLGIEIPDKIYDITVMQGSNKIGKATDERWILSNINSNVEISSPSLPQNIEICLTEKENPYILFKLSGQNLTQGRRVRYATYGTFLVIVPEDWRRNDQLSGIPRVPPTQCSIVGVKAHLFNVNLETEDRIAFLTSKDRPIEIPNRRSQFELVGSLIEDASETKGPLFGRNIPKLRCRDGASWRDITTVVLGEEGEKSSGWRTSFFPNSEVEIQDLTQSLQTRPGGWYFVRIYDSNEDLVESLDFRFALTLENISTAPHSALPGDQGHIAVRIEINHSNNTSIGLAKPTHRNLQATTSDTGTVIEIPPDPAVDKTDWILQIDKNTTVELSLLVKRVWWSICTQDVAHQNLKWTDKPIVLSPPYLSATSRHELIIRFPRRRWTKEVRVGFEQLKAREYRAEVTQQTVDIPLNHFESASELEDFAKDHFIKLWIDGFPEQTIAVLSQPNKADKKHVKPITLRAIKFKRRWLVKYLNRLDHTVNDEEYSVKLKKCKKNWSLPSDKDRYIEKMIQTAYVLKIGLEILNAKGVKPIWMRKGWVRNFIKIAETNPDYFNSINKRH